MAYQIDRYNNTLLTSVEDGTIDQTTDLKFIGKNYAGYGEIQNENFLFLLENFSGATQPPRPLSGQLWFDSANSKLKFYDGSQFRTTGGAEVSPTQPSGLAEGDFWWNTTNQQLFAFNGTDFTLVGPQSAPGAGVTQMQSASVTDIDDNTRTIIKGIIDDVVVIVISDEEFTLSVASAIPGFSVIKKGVTMVNTDVNGVTSGGFLYWGTASNATKLGGVDAANYVTANNPSFTSLVSFVDAGISIGNSEDLKIYIENDNQAVLANEVGNSNLIKFKANNGSGVNLHSLSITATGMQPAADSAFDLGTSSTKFRTAYADTFDGTATVAENLTLASVLYQPSLGAVNNTVALRDSSGDITANEFVGVALSAKFADLAEIYETDAEYPVGTVIAIGGEKEARAAKLGEVVVGVISENPAYLMNSEAKGQPIALKGRVPVRVLGPISKGQTVYVGEEGVGGTIASSGLVGVALETNNHADEKLVECILKV